MIDRTMSEEKKKNLAKYITLKGLILSPSQMLMKKKNVHLHNLYLKYRPQMCTNLGVNEKVKSHLKSTRIQKAP